MSKISKYERSSEEGYMNRDFAIAEARQGLFRFAPTDVQNDDDYHQTREQVGAMLEDTDITLFHKNSHTASSEEVSSIYCLCILANSLPNDVLLDPSNALNSEVLDFDEVDMSQDATAALILHFSAAQKVITDKALEIFENEVAKEPKPGITVKELKKLTLERELANTKQKK